MARAGAAVPRALGTLSASRPRRRFSRTLSRSRWPEYFRLLSAAREYGYLAVSLEDWLAADGPAEGPTLILRHDVDQHPRSALVMAAIDEEHNHRATWYFRWRTAHPHVVEGIRDRGHAVGLHYETLTRLAQERGLRDPDAITALIPEARERLRSEIEAWRARFGTLRSVCPHGDTRLPGVSNAVLLRGEDWPDYGIEFDGNEAMRGHRLGRWLTDRSGSEGGWVDAVNPQALLADRVSPILCLTHPNNWVSGPSLWVDRLLAAALPPPDGWIARPVRTGRDSPPVATTRP